MQRYKTVLKWVGVSIFIFIFHLVYNHFGHGVQSASLNWAWLIPLIPALIRGTLILTKIDVGADVKIMDRFFRHREVPDSENFSKPGFQLKTA
ncbi:hypothetical protein [Weissella cibaria]|uniref:hypothetical protein n=1 Tax=Weissella cibaria TaxID=137591 RepID=UPI001FF4D56C|nr:hypothetical protein [Weissella cibaria]